MHLRRDTTVTLGRDADRYRHQIELLADNSAQQLKMLNQSKFPPCSDAEKAWIRRSLYASGQFRDAGRIRAGKLLCSASFQNADLPQNSLELIGNQAEIGLYRAVPPLSHAKGRVILHEEGDFYVIPDPAWIFSFQEIVGHTESIIQDPKTGSRIRPDGLPSQISNAVNDRDEQGTLGDTFYVTRCSRDIDLCVVAWQSRSAVLSANRFLLLTNAAVGALFALVLVLLVLVIRIRHASVSYRVRKAIRQNKIRVLYQPIVELASGRTVGAEALMRFGGKTHAIRPDHFVKVAERHGLALELTERVLNCCLKDFAEQLRSCTGFRINVNLTASDLRDPRLLPLLDRRLAEEQVPAHSLALELTETSTAATAVAIQAIHQLAERGHSVQIDDFGTGYSSLSYLRDLRVDTIKIDRSFTHAIGSGSLTEKLVPQIVALAEALSLSLTVEGIETEEQLRYYLAMERPLLAQGWYFGRPVGAAEFRRRYLQPPALQQETPAASPVETDESKVFQRDQ